MFTNCSQFFKLNVIITLSDQISIWLLLFLEIAAQMAKIDHFFVKLAKIAPIHTQNQCLVVWSLSYLTFHRSRKCSIAQESAAMLIFKYCKRKTIDAHYCQTPIWKIIKIYKERIRREDVCFGEYCIHIEMFILFKLKFLYNVYR